MKISSYLRASAFLHTQQCWKVPMKTIQSWTVALNKVYWGHTTSGVLPLGSQVLEPPRDATA